MLRAAGTMCGLLTKCNAGTAPILNVPCGKLRPTNNLSAALLLLLLHLRLMLR
jgi:hypothetical protein